jgi:hypothetical protein
MVFNETRPNWLSEIIEAKRIVSDRPIPLLTRKAERDAIVDAIKSHPQGQVLAAMPDLPDLVWEALGAAYHLERDAQQSPHVLMASPAIHASLLMFGRARLRSE